MKSIIKYTVILSCLVSAVSCSLFQLDNYDAPEEILRGEVIDAETGEIFELEKRGQARLID